MIEIIATGDTTLRTAGRYCREDILVRVPRNLSEPKLYTTLKKPKALTVLVPSIANTSILSSFSTILPRFVNATVEEKIYVAVISETDTLERPATELIAYMTETETYTNITMEENVL